MTFLYLGALLVSMVCVGLIDRRWRLFVFAAPLRATLVIAAGTALMLAWDVAGIAAGIFFREPNTISTGILIAPHLPLEEPVFLVFLCQVVMVAYTGALRLITARERRRSVPA